MENLRFEHCYTLMAHIRPKLTSLRYKLGPEINQEAILPTRVKADHAFYNVGFRRPCPCGLCGSSELSPTHLLVRLMSYIGLYQSENNTNVLTAERIYHTVIEQSPFLVDKTTTVVWT